MSLFFKKDSGSPIIFQDNHRLPGSPIDKDPKPLIHTRFINTGMAAQNLSLSRGCKRKQGVNVYITVQRGSLRGREEVVG